MIYGLVIVTSLGATTLLGTYSQVECFKQASFINNKGPNSQAQCWPAASEEALRANIKQINDTVSNTTVIRK